MSRKMTHEEAVKLGKFGGLVNKAKRIAEGNKNYFKELGRRGVILRWERHRAKKLQVDKLTPES